MSFSPWFSLGGFVMHAMPWCMSAIKITFSHKVILQKWGCYRVDKNLNVIHYASKNLDSAQRNYATTKKEFLAVVFACD